MSNDMVTPAELAAYPGGPFTDDETDSAVETLRGAAFWHIAPEHKDDTVILDVPRGVRRLFLPTRKLTEVSEIRANDEIVDPDFYQVSTNLGMVRRVRGGYWPSGYGVIEVDMTHGYESVPLELLSVIAAIASTSRRDQTVRQSVAGPYTLPIVGMDKIIERYSVWHLQLGIA